MNLIDSPASTKQPKRTEPIAAVVVHATGEPDLDKLIAFYTNGVEKPHYMISTTGSVRRFVDEGHVAWHAAMKDRECDLYRLGYKVWSRFIWKDDAGVDAGLEQPRYRQWRDTWCSRGLNSPLQLATHDKPNFRSIGIELQSPARRQRDGFYDEQYDALAELLADIHARRGLPICRETVLGHYDVCPLRRSREGGNYDPGREFSYNRIWDALGIRRAPAPNV